MTFITINTSKLCFINISSCGYTGQSTGPARSSQPLQPLLAAPATQVQWWS